MLIFHKIVKIHQKVQMTLNYLERFQKLRRLRENMKKVELDTIDVKYYFKTHFNIMRILIQPGKDNVDVVDHFVCTGSTFKNLIYFYKFKVSMNEIII